MCSWCVYGWFLALVVDLLCVYGKLKDLIGSGKKVLQDMNQSAEAQPLAFRTGESTDPTDPMF